MAKSNSSVTGLDDDAGATTSSNEAVATAAATGAVIVGANHDSELSGDRRTVTIHPTDTDGGGDAVLVSVNGYAYQIPRGIPVDIPMEVLEILKNAKTTSYKAGANGAPVERTVQRFAFS